MGTTSAYAGAPADARGLDEVLGAFDRDRSYTTQRLFKENELERTELVADAQGRRFVRKYIAVDAGREHPYERLRGTVCPQLQHVREAVRIGERLVVVCDYVEGVSLRDYVAARGRLDEAEATRLLRDVCTALGVLHGMQGGAIVHRDVNPGNIIVSGGRAVLVDFGIARSCRDGAASDTRAWGTKGYAAPEQFGFQQTDARADVYGLGQVLRFMLVGGDSEDPLALQAAGVCDGLRDVYGKATRLDPADRFQSAAELADALGALRRDGLDAARSAACPGTAAGSAGENAAALEEHDFERRVRGLTKRSTLALVLWRVWQVIAVASAGIIVIGVRYACVNDPVPYKICGYLILGVLCFAVPLVMSANLANVNARLSWLRANRHLRLVAFWGIMWGVFILYLVVMSVLGLPVKTQG